MAYRTDPPEPPDSDVTITGIEYRMLCRAQVLVDAMNDGTIEECSKDPWRRHRRTWSIAANDEDGFYVEGEGRTFQDAIEEALRLEPVMEVCDERPKQSAPVVLWMALSVGAVELLQWII